MELIRFFILFFLMVFLFACGSEKKEMKVVVIVIDGAGWNTIDPLINKGRLPYFKKLKEEGAWADLQTLRPTISPMIWTTIDTGMNFTKHGVSDFTYQDEEGQKAPIDGYKKKARSVWSILNTYHKRSVVINWWVTYPTEAINGVIVSDIFNRILLVKDSERKKLKDSVYPHRYFYSLKKFATKNYFELMRERGIPDYPGLFDHQNPQRSSETVNILNQWRALTLQDILIEKVTRHLYNTETFDYFATYIRLADTAQHFSCKFIDSDLVNTTFEKLRNKSLTVAEREAFKWKICETIEPVYKYCENFLKMLIENNPDTYFIIVSDHGFALTRHGYNHTNVPKEYPPPPGIFLALGPDIVKGQFKGAHVYDIAPTILYMFNLPIGKKMDGRPFKEIFKFKRNIRYRTYIQKLKKKRKKKRNKELDEKKLKEFKTLGYIE